MTVCAEQNDEQKNKWIRNKDWLENLNIGGNEKNMKVLVFPFFLKKKNQSGMFFLVHSLFPYFLRVLTSNILVWAQSSGRIIHAVDGHIIFCII